MADVRRSVTWEDVGFARDRTTGSWTEVGFRSAARRDRVLASVARALGEHRLVDGICASCGPARTWEDLGFHQDRSTGRWVESAVRAGGHHYDPGQLRDPGGDNGGQWVAVPGAAEAMQLADALTEFLEDTVDGVESDDATETRAQLAAWAQHRYGGTFAGLRVEVAPDDVALVGDGIHVQGTIYDADNRKVGGFGRSLLRDDDDVLYARHDLLELKSSVQGQGFARAFNNHLIDGYRDGDVSRVELTANIDVGGYAWARAGYDFKDDEGKAAVGRRMGDLVDDVIMKSLDEDNPDAAEYAALVDKIDLIIGGVEDPTPYEISELGRDLPDADGMWFGKRVLLGSSWEGVLWL